MSKGYPGTQRRPLICDVCGFKMRLEDVTQVHDRYNPQNKLIVCKKDLDKLNPQFIPHKIPKDIFLSTPGMVRPEPENLTYIDNPGSDRLPGAARNLKVQLEPISGQLLLTWDGPVDPGSSPILGYLITRASPQLSHQFTIEANTQTSGGMFLDATANVDAEYTYQVAAISNVGIGAVSNIAFWPIQEVPDTINYLLVSQTSFVLTTGDGRAIIL